MPGFRGSGQHLPGYLPPEESGSLLSSRAAFRAGKREVERRPLARCGIEPYPPCMTFHDSFGNRQPDARSFILFAGMQALKHLKEAAAVFLIDPDSVIRDGKAPHIPILNGLSPDLNPGRALPMKFQGISQQI